MHPHVCKLRGYLVFPVRIDRETTQNGASKVRLDNTENRRRNRLFYPKSDEKFDSFSVRSTLHHFHEEVADVFDDPT
jgi:hypothetical protein